MGVKLITPHAMGERNFNANRSDVVRIFQGDRAFNSGSKEPKIIGKPEIVGMGSPVWNNSEGYHKLWQEIGELRHRVVNAAQAPAQSDIEALLGKMFIDVTRRAQEAGDLTSFFSTEITDLEADETMTARYLYKYIGLMGEVTGSNDSVNLIEQKLGTPDTFTLAIPALGWKGSLKNMLFNRVHEMQKVNQAAVDADTDWRNSKTIGAIVAATFVATQKQAADATSDATYDVLMYNTFRKAIKKLRNLKDPKTQRKIPVPSINVLCSPDDMDSIQRVINGQLETGGTNGTITVGNRQGLGIANMVAYDQGITNGYTYGKDTVSYPGVTAGKAYVYVPAAAHWTVNKRPLTLETGMGSVLQLSTEERAWYRCAGTYDKDFFGSSYAGASTTSEGYIIEVTLPADS